MKALTLLLAFVISTVVLASDLQWESLILEKMLHSMSKEKRVLVYADNPEMKQIVEMLKDTNIAPTDRCEDADFILVAKGDKNVCDKPEIVFNYASFLHDPNAVGVFFWQKGRPTIRFSAQRLKRYGLHIEGELSKFVSSNH